MSNGNGTGFSNKVILWIMALLTTTVLSLAGAWANHVNKQLDGLIETHQALIPRTAVVEERMKNLEANYTSIDKKLDRILSSYYFRTRPTEESVR